MPLDPSRATYNDSDLDAARRLLRLTTPDEASAGEQIARLHLELADEKADFTDFPIIDVLSRFPGFFFVDWKDDESMEWLIGRAATDIWRSDFRFPPDFETGTPGSLRIPELMHWARQELASHGLLLWHWCTWEDNYCGAICREADWPELVRVCALLEVEVLPADESFETMP